MGQSNGECAVPGLQDCAECCLLAGDPRLLFHTLSYTTGVWTPSRPISKTLLSAGFCIGSTDRKHSRQLEGTAKVEAIFCIWWQHEQGCGLLGFCHVSAVAPSVSGSARSWDLGHDTFPFHSSSSLIVVVSSIHQLLNNSTFSFLLFEI